MDTKQQGCSRCTQEPYFAFVISQKKFHAHATSTDLFFLTSVHHLSLHSWAGSVLNSRPWVPRGRARRGRTNPRGRAGSAGADPRCPGVQPAGAAAHGSAAREGLPAALSLASPFHRRLSAGSQARERPLAARPPRSALPPLRSAPRQVLPHPSQGPRRPAPLPPAPSAGAGDPGPPPGEVSRRWKVGGSPQAAGTRPGGARCTYSRFS